MTCPLCDDSGLRVVEVETTTLYGEPRTVHRYGPCGCGTRVNSTSGPLPIVNPDDTAGATVARPDRCARCHLRPPMLYSMLCHACWTVAMDAEGRGRPRRPR